MLLAGVFALLTLLLSLWRSRWAVAGVLVLTSATVAGVEYWRRWQSPILQAGGMVMVRDGTLRQTDQWFYQTSRDAADSGFAFTGVTHPVFASLRQWDKLAMELLCADDGRPRAFIYHLDQDMRMAFVNRSLAPDASGVSLSASREGSPLRPMVRELYLRSGDRMEDVAVDAVSWPGVLIQRNQQP